jgi:hypothetical protein
MITKYDELFCHQEVSTLDRPGTSAREWTERAWAQVHHIAGTGHLATGLGYYPNRNIMDAFACFTVQDKCYYEAPTTDAATNRAQWMAGTYEEEYARESGKWKFASIKTTWNYISPYDEGWAKNRGELLAGTREA